MTAVEELPVTESPKETTPPKPSPANLPLRAAGVALGLLGVFVLGFLAYLAVLSPLQHDRDQITRYADFRKELAEGTAPVAPPIAAGKSVAILEIPRLGLREVVVEGTTSADLAHGPGHRRDTPLPGQPGVSVILGRAGTYGGPFGDLGKLHTGDVVTVITGQGLASYTVSGTGPSILPPVPGSSTLVLVTADSGVAPRGEALVTARLTGQPVAGNSAEPPRIDRSEVGLSGDLGALIPLLLWAEALLLAIGLTTFSYLRWSRWPTYVISSPVLLAVLWNIYESLARLLPNTL
ncbi:sortase [Actinocorallia sp. A-T 12471]|uniref:sortase n=1 Tax=Actinocorallia sp. A-T 12471 TaxID=3089813 RepID=UPI0029CB24D8|nr:sortase [Actinocorallia sp. A-T 12471]MDX6739116.1 sortase [Actinocorallia sp. A-T 12471]